MYIYTIKSHLSIWPYDDVKIWNWYILVLYIHMAIFYLTRRPILQEPNASKIVKLSQRKHTTKIKGKSWENRQIIDQTWDTCSILQYL